jgi:tetratricopeptide (TPR) repeat protein
LTEGRLIQDRIAIARQLSLHGLALKELQQSTVANYGARGLNDLLDLLVNTGQAEEVLSWNDELIEQALNRKNYSWYRAQAHAALGQYEAADAELLNIAGGDISAKPNTTILAGTVADIITRDLMNEAPGITGLPQVVLRTIGRNAADTEMLSVEQQLFTLAEVALLRGLLAAESRQYVKARELWTDALSFSPVRTGNLEDWPHTMAREWLAYWQVDELNR